MVYLYKKKIKNTNYFYLRSSSRVKGRIVVKDISYLGKGIDKILSKAKNDEEVMAVLLFGSSLKKQGRDVDICLVLKNKKTNYEMTKKRLEYLKIGDYDLHIFQQLPLYIRNRILKENLILLSKNEKELYEIAFGTIKEFNLYKKLYKLCLEKIENG